MELSGKLYIFLNYIPKGEDILAGEQGMVQFIDVILQDILQSSMHASSTGFECNYTFFISIPILSI